MGSYRLNEPQIALEIVDGEAVVIDFESGVYFSITGSGGQIVELLGQGYTTEEIAEQLCQQYLAEPGEISRSVAEFTETLLSNQLIVPANLRVRTAAETTPAADRTPFPAPALERFEDLEWLLTMDPIHDVDQQGWPHKKAS